MGRRVALLVATYEHDDAGLRRLTAPAADAVALAEVLRNEDIAGFDVTVLRNEPHHKVGEVISDFYRDCNRDDLTLLYFTGHGLKDDDGRLYLATSNTRRDSLLFTSIPAEHIDYAMERCLSRQKILVLDCCYSGAFPAGRAVKADSEVHALEKFQGRGRTVLTASDSTQYSFEGDQLHGAATRSVFTHYLVEGLSDGSADRDGDGDITVDELYTYAHDRVVQSMPQQRPKMQTNVEGRTVIARNINWTMPGHLRNALNSPIANDRLNALDLLLHLHRMGNDHVQARVAAEIERLTRDDSRTVSAAAVARLQAIYSHTLSRHVSQPGIPASGLAPGPAEPILLGLHSSGSEMQQQVAFHLGVLRGEHGDVAGARTSFQQVIDSGHPTFAPTAARQLAILLAEHGDVGGARAAYQAAIDSGHADQAPKAANSLGLLLAVQADVAGARTAYQAAIDSGHPEHAPQAARNLGNLLVEHGDLVGGQAAYRQAIDSGHPEHAPMVARHLADLLAGQGDVAGARAAYQTAIGSGHSEHAPMAACNLGNLLVEHGDLAGGQAAYRQAIDSGHPKYAPMAARYLAILLAEQRDITGARAAYQTAIDSGQVDQAPKAANGLGLLLAEQGDVAGARAAYQTAVDSGHSEYAAIAASNMWLLP